MPINRVPRRSCSLFSKVLPIRLKAGPLRILALAAACFFVSNSAEAKIIYVKSGSPPLGTGTSWGSAFNFLRDALDEATPGDSIFMAAGTYYPDDAEDDPADPNDDKGFVGDRELTFVLDGVTVYGGFAGTETAIAQRDIVANPTILSGEIWSEVLYLDVYASLHVVVARNSCTLDGLTIQKGNANGDLTPVRLDGKLSEVTIPANRGAGCLAMSGTLTLRNCTFSRNRVRDSGGAVWGDPASVNVIAENCKFLDNEVKNATTFDPIATTVLTGGAITAANVTATDCTFARNAVIATPLAIRRIGTIYSATARGGAISGNTVNVTRCSFDANSTDSNVKDVSVDTKSPVTAIAAGGAISGITIAEFCDFTGNKATSKAENPVIPLPNPPSPPSISSSTGGAIAGQLTAMNCVFSRNNISAQTIGGDPAPESATISTAAGGALFLNNASAITNCIFTENTTRNLTLANYGEFKVLSRGGGVHFESTDPNVRLTVSSSTFLNNGNSISPVPANNRNGGAAISCAGSVRILNNILWSTANLSTPIPPATALEQGKQINVLDGNSGRISSRAYATPASITFNIVKNGPAAITLESGSSFKFADPNFVINRDPLFFAIANPIGPDGLWRTPDDGLRLLAGSSAFGIGRKPVEVSGPVSDLADTLDLDEDGNVLEELPYDAARYARTQDGILDLGAYEFGEFRIVPDISVEQPVGTFLVDGTSVVDFSSFPREATTFVIRNTGTEVLRRLIVTGSGANINEYAFSQPSVTTLAAGGTATFTVTFNPLVTGVRTARIHVASSDLDENPFDITVQGSATIPDIAIEHPTGTNLTDGVSSIDFGAVGSTTSTSKTFTIRNTGFASLSISDITSAGPNAANFIPSAPAQSDLAPGATTTFRVVFRPSGIGARSGSVVIRSTDPDETSFTVGLTGSGFDAPEIVVSEPFSPEIADGGTVGFGSVKVGLLHTKTFVIKNAGLGTLKSIGVGLSGSGSFTRTNLKVTSLSGGKQTKFTVTFKPTKTGKKTASLIITSNDTDEGRIVINLTGEGISASASRKRLSASAASAPLAAPPLSAPRNGVVTVTQESDGLKYLVLTIDKPAVGAAAEVSSNLTEWFSGKKYTTTLMDNASVLRVRDNTPVRQGEKRYIRLK